MPVYKIITEKNAKIGIWKLSETVDELENKIFSELSDDEKTKYRQFKSQQRKKEWLATRILLKEIKKSPFHTIITYNEACKPKVKNEYIGISHSRDFVAVIISEKNQVSVDIERISNKPQKIIRKFLSDDEKISFNTDNQQVTTLLWSTKECVYKYHSTKNLPFIDGIKILPSEIKNKGLLNAILQDKIKLIIKYLSIENNILTYIDDNF